MQAAVYKPGSPFLNVVDDHPIPEPGPFDVVIEVLASGVCGTDVTCFLSRTTLNIYSSDSPTISRKQLFFTNQFAADPRT
jgi:D-arabinose 1-dehydrogenase-like Zn-dependent alcohol dehydrogenase